MPMSFYLTILLLLSSKKINVYNDIYQLFHNFVEAGINYIKS